MWCNCSSSSESGCGATTNEDENTACTGISAVCGTVSKRPLVHPNWEVKTGDGVQVQGVAAGVFLVNPMLRPCAGTKPITVTEKAFPVERNAEEAGPTTVFVG